MAGYTPQEKLFETSWSSSVKAHEAFALLYTVVIKPMQERIAALEAPHGNKAPVAKKTTKK